MKTGNAVKWVLFLIGFVLYAQTTVYDYALDDKIVITKNQITKKGFSGIFQHFEHDAMDGFWAAEYGVPVEELNKSSLVAGGRYRPLTLAMHSIEWGLFGESPGVSHFVNALLYAFLVLIIYLWAARLLKEPHRADFYKSYAFWAALLFAVHPLHTEVVANIKGRDEILSFLFAALALNEAQKAYDRNEIKQIWKPMLLFFASFLSKESTVTFVAIWPAALWFFRKEEFGTTVKWSWQPIAVAAVYLLIRSSVIDAGDGEPGQLMNNPFLNASNAQKSASVALTFAAYLKLNFWPHPLTHDYYPYHLPFTDAEMQYPDWSHPAALAGLIISAALIVITLIGTFKRDIRVFGLAVFFITFIPVSNLLFPVGVFMNERFMFIPSLGIILTVLLTVRARMSREKEIKPAWIGILSLAAIVFSALTVNRNTAWENDESLALTDVEVSVGSAKAQMSAGDALIRLISEEKNQKRKNELINRAFNHLKRSLEIHPSYFPPNDLLGQLYFHAGNYEESVKWYDRCAQMKPGRPQFISNMHAGAQKLKENEKYEASLNAYNRIIERDPQNIRAYESAAEIYARRMGRTDAALDYLSRALNVDPDNGSVLEKTGIVYAMRNDFENAFHYFERASEQRPDDPGIMKNMGVTYIQLGEEEKGKALIRRAEQLEAAN